jgi:hypothetical protein
LTSLTRLLIYPFSVWQTIMLMWALVLMPFSLWRKRPVYFRDIIARLRKPSSDNDEEKIALEVVTE